MTQRQVEESKYCAVEDFDTIHLEQNQVTYQLDERFSLVVKRSIQDIYILLRSGTKCIKVPYDVFNLICNAQVSVAYLKQCLEDQHVALPWLCPYCGLQFVSKKKCTNHEKNEHLRTADSSCFHAYPIDCDTCEKVKCESVNNF
jgi:hypothetical protein